MKISKVLQDATPLLINNDVEIRKLEGRLKTIDKMTLFLERLFDVVC